MPDTPLDLEAALKPVISEELPRFSHVYSRFRRRALLWWLVSFVIAVTLGVGGYLLFKSPQVPTFYDQVSAFVDLVYRD